jgi:hypothetical protein
MNVRRLLPPVFALAAALFVGFALGRCTGGPDVSAPAPASTLALASPARAPERPLSLPPSAAASAQESDPSKALTAPGIEEALAEPVALRRYVRLAAAVEALDRDQIFAALEQIGGTGREDDRATAARHALISRLAELDPAGAAAYAIQSPAKDHADLLQPALEVWLQIDPAAALAWADSLSAGKPRAEAQGMLALFLSQTNPDLALALGAAAQTGGGPQYLTSQILEKLAGKDPLDAASRALKLPPASDRASTLQSVLRTWAEKDPGAALAWAGQLPDHRDRATASLSAIAAWGGKDAPAAGAYLLAHVDMADLRQNPSAVFQIADTWAGSDPAAALAWMEQLPGGIRSNYESRIFQAWSETDPAGAAQAALGLSSPNARNNALSSVMQNWADKDLNAARAWFERLPDGPSRENVLSTLGNVWVQHDPRAAADFLLRQKPAGEDGSDWPLNLAVAQWAQSDPAAALAWTRAMPEGNQRDEVVLATLRQRAQNDPAQAAAQIDQLSPARRLIGVKDFAQNWAGADGQAAAVWAQTLPISQERETALEVVAQTWGNEDPAAAAAWLAAQPRDAATDNATIKVVEAMAQNDPAAAARLAEGMADAALRERAAAKVASQWSGSDSPAARAWITSTPALSAADRESLLNPHPID